MENKQTVTTTQIKGLITFCHSRFSKRPYARNFWVLVAAHKIQKLYENQELHDKKVRQ